MADKKNTPSAFDAWLATVNQPNVSTTPANQSEPITKPAVGNVNPLGPTAGQTEAATQHAEAAFEAAAGAASDLHQALAQLKTGAISKKQAEGVFNDYQARLAALKAVDPTRAQSVDSGFHTAPTSSPIAPAGAANATTGVQGPAAHIDPNATGLLGPNNPSATATTPKATTKTTGTGTTSKSGTGGTGTGSSGNKNTPPANTPQSRQALLDQFIASNPNEWAIIQSDPSLQKIFADGLQKGWSADKFQIAYENSPYYINHQSSYLDSEGARLGSGKGKWVETYNNALHDAQQLAIAQGLNIDPANFGITPDNPTGKLKIVNGQIVGQDNNQPFVYDPKNPNLVGYVLNHYYNTGVGPNATAITNYFATKNQIDPQHMSGVFGQNVDQLKSWANDLGMNNLLLKGNSNYFTDAANSIASGKQNLEYFHQDLMNQAAQAYPVYGNQIKAGLSLRSIAAPYINTLSGLLETTPDQLDLSAPTGDGAMIRKALQGNGIDTPTSLTDFATQVRQDPRWAKTLNAQNDVEATAHKILTDFGVAS